MESYFGSLSYVQSASHKNGEIQKSIYYIVITEFAANADYFFLTDENLYI